MKKIFGKKKKGLLKATLIPRAQHRISRQDISPNALKVLYRLHEAGFAAHLVGGGVRDLLLGLTPKDFDIATDATPEQVKKLFRNCLLIGRRFRLAHIRFGREIIEVATFRGSESTKSSKHRHTAEHGMLLRDNVYGTVEEDALRRDFTVNALYYNIADFSVIDFCNGAQDLQDKTLRIIGDPDKRYREDPVRLLRTIRFAGKLDLDIASDTAKPIIELAPLLQLVPAARLFDEVLKLFHSGKAFAIFQLLHHYHLFAELFPQTEHCLNIANSNTQALLETVCKNTDARVNEGKTLSPAFLLACLLWHPVKNVSEKLIEQGCTPNVAQDKAAQEVFNKQMKRTSIPKRFSIATREIWQLQHRLLLLPKRYITALAQNTRFRAAYDFLLLRNAIGEIPDTATAWWTQFIAADDTVRQQLIKKLPSSAKRRKRK